MRVRTADLGRHNTSGQHLGGPARLQTSWFCFHRVAAAPASQPRRGRVLRHESTYTHADIPETLPVGPARRDHGPWLEEPSRAERSCPGALRWPCPGHQCGGVRAPRPLGARRSGSLLCVSTRRQGGRAVQERSLLQDKAWTHGRLHSIVRLHWLETTAVLRAAQWRSRGGGSFRFLAFCC
ncbi:hypothetical protein BDA96_01G087200 [Sorghum bicolor]|uniref:Uncharacterized protein n=2 Tax=Sorghum bicolor TaxID=4558 RepID=A0A921RX77_SORBI|nr:hypothetical protein BDA96_01G087200 [Sorghum bicolor]OQU90954.1 hypothetical protein SORBI_3001G083450 [Sorghum bicolor]